MMCGCCGRRLTNDQSADNLGFWMHGPHGPIPYCADDPGGLCERTAANLAGVMR